MPEHRSRPDLPPARSDLPVAQGLYDPSFEHDSCGVSFVVHMKGLRSRSIVDHGIGALINLEHRGASGSEVNTGDGAGILIQIPDRFLREVVGFPLPSEGAYATGIAFLPEDPERAAEAVTSVEKIAVSEGLRVLGWRDVPIDDSMIGSTARAVEPSFRQIFLAGDGLADESLERRVYIVRKRIEHEVGSPGGDGSVYFPSLSCRTIVYKGMLTTPQLSEFFADLRDDRVESALALVHSRFSTNTFPSWPLAHPFRYIAHNGEINTVQGNRNWMQAREALLASDLLPGELDRIFPICTPGASDSATFDEVLELLHMGGYSLPHAVLMMIPEAWENHQLMSDELKAFYRYHSSLMEPWDGPASIAFTDGTVMGAVLDRNGLRPSRYWVTADDLVIMASEVGVIDVDPARVVEKGRLRPGRMFLVDTAKGRIVGDHELKAELAAAHPYQQWLDENLVQLDALAARDHELRPHRDVVARQQVFGYTNEELKILIEPMARTGLEPIGSMGTDTPIAALSSRSRLLFDYFIQLFAQVTNPPLDAIREELVTSISGSMGPEANLLDPTASSCRQISVARPILNNDELDPLMEVTSSTSSCTSTATTTWPTSARSPSRACSRCPRVASACSRRSTRCAARPPRPSRAGPRSSSSPTVTPPRSWPRSRRCCSPARCTTTSSGRRPAPGSGSWSSAAMPARCTTWRCCSATARRPSTRTWRSSPSRTSSPRT
jgi:glutamate synthase (NADPH) large chain